VKTISSILRAQLGLHQIESVEDPLLKSLFEDQSTSAVPSDLSSSVWANAFNGLAALNGGGTGASTASVIQSPIAISHDETRANTVFSFNEADGSSIPFGTPIYNSSFGQLFSAPTAAPTPNLTISWGGATQSQPGNLNPSDCSIAAGTNNIITVVNNHIDIYSKAGVDLSSQSLNTFFNQPSSSFLFDPRVTWDQFSGRFIVTAGDNTTHAIHLAVSRDSNPLDGWYQYNFPFGVDVDQPLIGLDSSTVYISGEYDGPNYFLIALDRNTVEAGNAVTPYAYTWQSLGAPSADRYVPAHMYGSHIGFNGDFMLEYVQNFGNDTLRVIEVGNAASSSPTQNIQSLNLGNISDTALQGARQPGTTITLNDGNGFAYSGKIDNAVWRADKLYAVNEIRVGSGANAHEVVHWFVVDTSNLNNLTLLSQGNIDYGPSYDTYYGAMTVDNVGNMIIGYSFSGPTVYASSVYAVIAAGGTGLQDSGTYLTQGLGTNTNVDSRVPGTARWGDYSGVSIDPTDEKSFWIFNEYATNSNSWATTVGGFQLSQPAG
jgi:hypothetical protein